MHDLKAASFFLYDAGEKGEALGITKEWYGTASYPDRESRFQ